MVHLGQRVFWKAVWNRDAVTIDDIISEQPPLTQRIFKVALKQIREKGEVLVTQSLDGTLTTLCHVQNDGTGIMLAFRTRRKRQ